MSDIELKNRHCYTRSLGLLKNAVDTARASRDLLLISVTTPSTRQYRVLLDRYNLWIVAVSPGADASDFYFFADLCDEYAAPTGMTKKKLPIGGSHAELGTWDDKCKFTYDSYKRLDALAEYSGGTVGASDIRDALSLTVVAISEASRFRSILEDMAEVLARRKTVKGVELKARVNNWQAWSRQGEGKRPDIRIHHRPGKSPCQR